MKKGIQILLVVACLMCAVVVHAKTASEVFDATSASIVVIRTYDAKGKAKGLGSGVVLASDVIATNCHVLEDAVNMKVMYRKKEYTATRLHSDPDRDVCTLSVYGIKAPVVMKGNTSKLKVGARVYVIGAPEGLELTLSEGIISSLRPIAGGQYLQITAPISPGSSGGGLFDEEGRLIGLPTFFLTEGQQLNFAIPVEWVSELPNRHKKTVKTVQTSSLDWLNKAVAFEEKKDWNGLVNHSLRWTKAQPQDYMSWFSLGVAYNETKLYPVAIEALQQSLQINQKFDLAWNSLGIAYNKLKQYPKAIDAFLRALEINPDDAKPWYELGNAYNQSGQYPKAIEAFQQVLQVNPEDDKTWNDLGVAYGRNNQMQQGVEAYQQALRINPESALAWYNLGNCYLVEFKQYSKAIEAFQQAVRINPDYAFAWSDLGLAYGLSSLHAKAIEAYQHAMILNPNNSHSLFNLGNAYKFSGQTEQVMQVYKRLKTLDPAKADEFFNKFVMP